VYGPSWRFRIAERNGETGRSGLLGFVGFVVKKEVIENDRLLWFGW
jgi:hypothetical protein